MKNVYCAVRAGSLNTAVCASSLKGSITYTSEFRVSHDTALGILSWLQSDSISKCTGGKAAGE